MTPPLIQDGLPKDGRSPDGSGSQATPEATEVSSPSVSIPSAGPDRIGEFERALFEIPWIAERITAGQQFNAYESADNDEDDDPYDLRYALCVGPIGDHRFICPIIGQDRAALVEAAMKLATVAWQQRKAWDIRRDAEDAARRFGFSPASGIEAATAGETQGGSTEGESPTAESGAQPTGQNPSTERNGR